MEPRIIKLIADILKIDENNFDRNTKITDIPQWDSLMSLMILSKIKEELNVDIPINKAIVMDKVSDYIDYIEEK